MLFKVYTAVVLPIISLICTLEHFLKKLVSPKYTAINSKLFWMHQYEELVKAFHGIWPQMIFERLLPISANRFLPALKVQLISRNSICGPFQGHYSARVHKLPLGNSIPSNLQLWQFPLLA